MEYNKKEKGQVTRMDFPPRHDELMTLYRALPGNERRALRLLAAAFGPVPERAFASMLRAFGMEAEAASAPETLASWRGKGLCPAAGDGTCAVSPDIRESVAREALADGSFERCCRAAETEIAPPRAARSGRGEASTSFAEAWQAVYFLRKYLFLGDGGAVEKTGRVSVADGRPWRELLAREVLLPPGGGVELIPRLGGEARFLYAEAAAEFTSDAALRRALTATMYDIALSRGGERAVSAAKALCDLGEFEKAGRLRPLLPEERRTWLSAIDALVLGDAPKAARLFARRMARARASLGPGAETDPWDLFYLPLLASSGAAPGVVARRSATLAKRARPAAFGAVFKLQAALARGASAEREFRASPLVKSLSDAVAGQSDPAKFLTEGIGGSLGPVALAHVFFLCVRVAPSLAKTWLPAFGTLAGELARRGRVFLAGELGAVSRAAAGEDAGNEWRPVRALFSRAEGWERALDAIETLAGESSAARKRGARRRLLWLVDWEPSGDAGSRAVRPTVRAVERTLSADGAWTKGRAVALSAIASGFPRVPGLPERDRRVRDAVRARNLGFRGRALELDSSEALRLLAGNPSVARARDFAPLEIVAAEPELVIDESADFCRARVIPAPPPEGSVLVEEETPARLRVTTFDESARALAALLGAGIAVPARAKDRLLKAVSSLSSSVAVRSNAGGPPENISNAECDGRLRVLLCPAGEGLNVEFAVRPLGPGGAPCRPGEGAEILSGGADASGVTARVRVRRDLAREKRAFAAAVAALPVLGRGDRQSASFWTLPDPGDCLELLLELKKLPDIVAEWPRGCDRAVRAELDGSTFAGAALASAADWFAVSGTVTVDSSLTLSLSRLIDLTRVSRGRFVPIGEGQYLALTREFERRIRLLGALAEEKDGTLRLPPVAAPAVDEMFGPSLATDAKWSEVCARFREAGRIRPEVPRTLRAALRPYQAEGFRWLSRLAHCGAGACLADEMGLGKTIQTLALLLSRAPGGPALIVSPTSVCGNWRDEAARFAPTLNVVDYRASGRAGALNSLSPFDAVLVSYGLLRNDADAFARVFWHTIVLDEAQAVKNMDTGRSAAVMGLKGAFRVALTGTPVENRLDELWNLFRFINPGLLGSFERFSRVFAVPAAEGDELAMSRLRRIVAPFLLRRSKEQVLDDLPPRADITLKVDLGDAERAFYEALRRGAAREIEKASLLPERDKRFVIFAQLTKLRRCCCSVSLTREGASLGARVPSSKTRAMLELAARLRGDGHRALVFSQFTDHLKLVKGALESAGYTCLYLDGSTPAAKRTGLVSDFQSGRGDFFLISLRAGGTGLNLTAADYVVHLDPWWNPAVEDQASDRAHRIGQTRPVVVYRLVARGTIEEKIIDLHRAKRALARDVLPKAPFATPDAEFLSALVGETS